MLTDCQVADGIRHSSIASLTKHSLGTSLLSNKLARWFGVKWHETVESRDRQININYQYLQYSVSAVVEVHAECPDGQRGTDLHLRLGQPARIRGGGDPRGPQSGWAYASWRVSLVQNQQNKARPTWVSPSQDRHPFSIDS